MKHSFSTSRNRSAMHEIPSPESCSLEASKFELLSSMDILKDLTEDEIEALMDKSPMPSSSGPPNWDLPIRRRWISIPRSKKPISPIPRTLT